MTQDKAEIPKSFADLSLEGLENNQPGYVKLYKYQRITNYSIEALEKGYVYFSSYEQLNDPFDPFVRLFKSDKNDLIKLMGEKGPKIFCVTPNPSNYLMWAHYADSGNGMCIGYAVSIQNPTFFNPVKYTDDVRVENFNSIMDLLLIKSSIWSYEEEWRGNFYTDEQKMYNLIHPISIFLGPKCSHENMVKIKSILPKTVRDFYMLIPSIENFQFKYQLYSIDELLKAFGKLPTIDEVIDYKRGRV